MSKSITIAVDAMGGDNAPDIVLEGIALALEQIPNIHILLFGDEKKLKKSVTSEYPSIEKNVTYKHTVDVVSSIDKPSQALRKGRKSSMALAIQSVKAGEAAVAVSAGNTGALMALSKFILRTMPNIDRPALCAPMPTIRGESVMLDLGANIECDANNLVQFAIMGSAYARTVLGLSNPSVGLLNVGVEDLKGKESIREAAEVLKEATHLPLKFGGFVEGDGVTSGEFDVIVSDGFTGNVALKTAEGTVKFISQLLKNAFSNSILSKIGYIFSKGAISNLKEHLDPNHHNGAVFLGLNGLVVKSHGGANGVGFANALMVASDMAQNDITNLIGNDLNEITDSEELAIVNSLK
ncbi:phosphate acyltransferase PlsX [Temperatibacter marinus]|uniref:Phosphate acyltransferase n=1 Tax=Temperatibacter marinus TaxID=1456591 RepID=A0AA52H8L1_9PROT|nr:phosphate acyltransferase PlsX [Temperatibacter marinus]WND02241.1 phosphate acyltransferase PlsX [Temperatibacter marinus]